MVRARNRGNRNSGGGNGGNGGDGGRNNTPSQRSNSNGRGRGGGGGAGAGAGAGGRDGKDESKIAAKSARGPKAGRDRYKNQRGSAAPQNTDDSRTNQQDSSNGGGGGGRNRRGNDRSRSRSRGRQSSGGRGGGRQSNRNDNNKSKAPASQEDLDREMDEYFMKSGNKDLVNKKLDDDMDAYWADRNAAKDETNGGTDTKDGELIGNNDLEGKDEQLVVETAAVDAGGE
mmetsp:Transcript_30996/g.31274  ORF Transcript_30996/g.31274 Transcript_30996/m.31274 type:complete len:229 (-) Transcript_30996:504-1190(-)|eukprot:CAMPEP_0171324990 /NCGR_PEP_ID=MMETSP0816-20121228/116536_1 /TAXON_ID=420281 /ORGANISM="Proboscia inermis, Strain CCAP1064/1" /LENGTH=228 /DNA_ID=CAMNT_0011824069 /DNA_START=86 /DNA_END=775 /DNA_ORIENTATION=+